MTLTEKSDKDGELTYFT